MDKKVAKNNNTDQSNYSELQIDDPEDLSPIIINTVLPNDLNQNSLTGNVPLFIKKLWKMVNDDNAEDIISWNMNGDGFIIHNQLKFVSETLPKYFKHNHLSSFVRQLNLYDFHKIQNVDKEEFQFNHPFFLKEVPQLLPLIKRKPTIGRHKTTTTNKSESSTEANEVMDAVKDIRAKSDVITNELSKLRQENAALWGEINSLRVKYSKQTKIINKLIHFLISYMQKHHNARKGGRTVSTNNANKYLKTGPKIMELDYRYKNNPHDFWTEYDNQHRNNEQSEQVEYTVVEPGESNMELATDLDKKSEDKKIAVLLNLIGDEALELYNTFDIPSTVEGQSRGHERNSPNLSVSSTIEELLPGSSAFSQIAGTSIDETLPQIDYTRSQPSSSKKTNSALQRTGGSKDNLGYFIDNTQIELNTIKELLKNLTPEEMTNFYKLVNDNYKNQDDESLDINSESDSIENELLTLAQMSPLNNTVQEQDPNVFEADENELITIPFKANQNVHDISTHKKPSENAPNLEIDPNTFSIPQEELLNTEDLLNNVSVDQYFN